MTTRIGLVVHPQRALASALETIRTWADRGGVDLVQVRTGGQGREVATPGDAADCDLVVAMGGDGTALAALHAAAPAGRPVLGVACGSLGALTATTAEELSDALERVAAGDWEARGLPALIARTDGHEELMAVNDLVLVRAGAGQVAVEIEVNGQRFVRFAGDGLVTATPIGSSAYTLAAGGPMLAPGVDGLVLTPLAPHGGVCPPLVTSTGTQVIVTLDAGNGGARVEVDGQVRRAAAAHSVAAFALDLRPDYVRLVSLGEQEPLIAGLRRRRILLDSPRVLARDDREAAAAARAAAASVRAAGPAIRS